MTTTQPPPTRSADSKPITCDLIELILQRRKLGISKYGTELHTLNGRNALQDALEESLDLNQYLFQHAAELRDRLAQQDPVLTTTELTIRDIRSVHTTAFGKQTMAVLSNGRDDIAAFPVTLPPPGGAASATPSPRPSDDPDRLTIRPSVLAFALAIEELLQDDDKDQVDWRSRSLDEHKDDARNIFSFALEQIRNDEHLAATINIVASATHLMFMWDKITLFTTDPERPTDGQDARPTEEKPIAAQEGGHATPDPSAT